MLCEAAAAAVALFAVEEGWAVLVIELVVVGDALVATAESCAAFWSHCGPSVAYCPVPFRKSLMCWRWRSVYWPAAAITSALAPFAFGCGKLKSEKSSTNLQ